MRAWWAGRAGASSWWACGLRRPSQRVSPCRSAATSVFPDNASGSALTLRSGSTSAPVLLGVSATPECEQTPGHCRSGRGRGQEGARWTAHPGHRSGSQRRHYSSPRRRHAHWRSGNSGHVGTPSFPGRGSQHAQVCPLLCLAAPHAPSCRPGPPPGQLAPWLRSGRTFSIFPMALMGWPAGCASKEERPPSLPGAHLPLSQLRLWAVKTLGHCLACRDHRARSLSLRPWAQRPGHQGYWKGLTGDGQSPELFP